MSQKIGELAEKKAKIFLCAQGLTWVESNYRCKMGEIDLIMRDKEYLVFVEVRARATAAFGGAFASVTYSKQQKLIKTAGYYLLHYPLLNKQPQRFDVISIEGPAQQLRWLPNAFGLDF